MKAEETVEKIDAELNELQATLANIENARPFQDLTVNFVSSLLPLRSSNTTSQVTDVGAAHPHITEAVENMVRKGKWTVPGNFSTFLSYIRLLSHTFPGYKEKFGDLSIL